MTPTSSGRRYLSGHHVDVLSERNLSRPKMSKAKTLRQQQASQTPGAVACRRPEMQQQKRNSSSSSRNLIAREGGGRGRRRGSGAGDGRGRRLRSAKHGCREGGVPTRGGAGDGRRGDEEEMLWARLARRQCLEAEVASAGR
ncbi:hypothetical protein VPH35_001636 [Triticum aestivum]